VIASKAGDVQCNAAFDDHDGVTISPLSLSRGFSSTPQLRSLLSNSSCSIAVDCLDCSQEGLGNWTVVLPWHYQLVEYEVWMNAATSGGSSRMYGVLAPMQSTTLLDKQAELHFSLLQAFYNDERADAPGRKDSIPASATSEGALTRVEPSSLYSSGSGFELAFQYYSTITPQNSSSLFASSLTALSFIFNPSDLVYTTSVTDKVSRAQQLFSILATVVSLFTLFSIVRCISSKHVIVCAQQSWRSICADKGCNCALSVQCVDFQIERDGHAAAQDFSHRHYHDTAAIRRWRCG
jgi:hypothetical protein